MRFRTRVAVTARANCVHATRPITASRALWAPLWLGGPDRSQAGRQVRRTAAQLQVLGDRAPADLLAEPDAILTGRAEVDAGIDPRVGVFLGGRGEALEGSGDAGKRGSAGHGERDLVVAKHAGKHRGGRTAGNAVRGGV